ncbi:MULTISPECIES: NUDIX hydrolase [Peribacillus]|uniref:NUDIX hydrolase n=1 Tax=Peribacillus TaxID=2675229 RepID=UPI001912F7CD|nr:MULTISPECIES: NUDIX domain-containing protein [unclassified Peribacillus]MBK5462098.1 NUDIX hydrolase [Peribacillus sp. TH27]MBK5500253.1 NUDIX hydrolase [Peribacillus sp. TH14]
MENEMLKVFNADRKQIGVATREEVHRMGHWHEVFHCWFVSREAGVDYLYLQHRCEMKKDYPNLLDITAAGHLLAHETIYDGVREIKEEIGIEVSFDKLVSLGVIEYHVTKENFIDKELANVFLYESTQCFDDFTLQKEEVSGMVKVELDDFEDLWDGTKEEVNIQGFEINQDDHRMMIDQYVGRDKFVPHDISYYKSIIRLIRENLS